MPVLVTQPALWFLIQTALFYAATLTYSYFFSVGGITADPQRRVLDGDKQPAPGLYGIGDDVWHWERRQYAVPQDKVAPNFCPELLR